LLHCNSGFNCCNCHFRKNLIDLSSRPRNSLSVPRNQTAPRNASPVPRNRSDVPRNAKIVPGNILALRNAGMVPGNAKNQNEQVSFSYASRLLFGKAESPRGDMNLGQHSLFFMFRCTCVLVNARPPSEDTGSLPREPLLSPPPRFRDGLEEGPEIPYRGLLVHFIYSVIRSCTKRAVLKIGDVQRTLSGIGSRSTGSLSLRTPWCR
jgi:hypothetical protein